jgi:hypothetical protein
MIDDTMRRERPYLSGNEAPRRYSDIKAECAEIDPDQRRRAHIMTEIDRLETEARAAGHPADRERIQLEAEELRTGLYHAGTTPRRLIANTGGRLIVTR